MQSTLPLQLNPTQGIQELPRTVAGKAFLAIRATALVALCAHVSLPLYFTPVPLTLQTLAVILVDSLSARGLAAQPWCSTSPRVQWVCRSLVRRAQAASLNCLARPLVFCSPIRLPPRWQAAWFASSASAVRSSCRSPCRNRRQRCHLLHGRGLDATLLHLSPAAAWHLSVAPFLPGEALKIIAAAAAYVALRRWRRRFESHRLSPTRLRGHRPPRSSQDISCSTLNHNTEERQKMTATSTAIQEISIAHSPRFRRRLHVLWARHQQGARP